MDTLTRIATLSANEATMDAAPKFSPGPWSVPHFAMPDVNCECKYVLCDHLMGAVASVHCSGEGNDWQNHGDNPRFEEAVANAYLIAAAPDMFEALQVARTQVEILQARLGIKDPGNGTLSIIDAALAVASRSEEALRRVSASGEGEIG